MRALIMGGTEFISLHLVQSLLARGHEVAVFNRGRRGERLPPGVEAADKPGPVFGQNLVYDCHAVHTTHKLRTELGIRPRYTLASGLHHTWKWYQASGLLERPIDFTFEDELLAKLGA